MTTDELRYAGPPDEQVEIRGYRVELGEVQAALAGLAGVDQAAAIVREDRPGGKRLVGYVTESIAGTVDPRGARATLTEQLPSYLVPAAVLVVPALPLTVDGKPDIRALPAPEYPDAHRHRAIEQVLAGIFAQILGVEQVADSRPRRWPCRTSSRPASTWV